MVTKHLRNLHNRLKTFLGKLFKKNKEIKLGLYGPPNSGKSTLANTICMDWLGEELSTVSGIAHETREIQIKEKVIIENNGKKITFSVVDTPGIATKIDFEDFLKGGMKRPEAKERAKEATKGVIESIKWLDKMDAVLVILDATKDPINQVNITILGNLEARGIPVLIVANKLDLKESNATAIRSAFPQYEVIGISAKEKHNTEQLYQKLFEVL
ncbi:MAG: 50S ribosome-binding GTPase [Candidatus Aenigmarchaeota archaeon]|nr:50S ribosome-binding GTPase [Candidatus Aenigmarchaeota archaeon]